MPQTQPLPPIDPNLLIKGQRYTRRHLYEIFQVPSERQHGNWDTGYHRYAEWCFIFANVTAAGRTGHDYDNHWRDDVHLIWRGRNGSNARHPSIQRLTDRDAKVFLFTREDDRDPFTYHGTAKAIEVQDTVPVTVVWTLQGVSQTISGTGTSQSNVIRHLTDPERSEFYPVIRALLNVSTPSAVHPVVCDLQASGGYDGQVTASITPGETFEVERAFSDPTRFPVRIRAAATALRDAGLFGEFRIAHEDGTLRIAQVSSEFEPTADEGQLDRATRKLLRRGGVRKPIGIAHPAKVVTTQEAFVRDPQVRAWVLENAAGLCEACGERGPFLLDDGAPFLEVHHVKSLAEGGSDQISNAIAACPNCHRRFHYSADRAEFTETIFAKVDRLIRE